MAALNRARDEANDDGYSGGWFVWRNNESRALKKRPDAAPKPRSKPLADPVAEAKRQKRNAYAREYNARKRRSEGITI